MKTLRAIDICSGAGGWACAARGLPIEIVAAFDREEDALSTYKLNHPGVETVLGDVVTQDYARWKGIDLILGGIPCEQVSAYRSMTKTNAAEIEGLGLLLDRCLGLPKELDAQWWCYEDVAQLEKHLPPLTPFFEADAKKFSAQSRKRIFLGNVPHPLAPNSPALLRDALRRGPYRVGERLIGRTPTRVNAFTPTTFYPWEPDRKSPTVITLTSRRDSEAATPHGEHWRQLEWQELAALQGFPEDYLFVGSPSRVVKMVAQAVQIDVGRAILAGLVDSL